MSDDDDGNDDETLTGHPLATDRLCTYHVPLLSINDSGRGLLARG